MGTRSYFRGALGITLAAVIPAGCSGLQPPIGAPGAMPQGSAFLPRADSTGYKVVYSFGGSPDGAGPMASLIDVDNLLYGTTTTGGAYYCISSDVGCGTIFSVTPGGTEKVLHNFGRNPDGNLPAAGLIDVNGMLYGTTLAGGSHYCRSLETNCGTVFSITTDGAEEVVHSFRGGPHDGSAPVAPLLDVNGTLYGTTEYGGKYCLAHSEGGCGTVFKITADGAERILHNFAGSPDGASPQGGLVEVNGTLYGTTDSAGANGGGTVFSITLGGVEKVLHSFGPYPDGADGSYPVGGLVEIHGKLYGATANGGKHHAHGVVFSITMGGLEKVLHSFSGSDGAFPEAGLVDVGGTLYGTASAGGAYNGQGTVFSLTTAGVETVLHNFGKGTDGSGPAAALYYAGGKLFGTTSEGGVHGKGTVFSLTP